MNQFAVMVFCVVISGCAGLEPKTISSADLGMQEELVFAVSEENAVEATRGVFAEQGWKMLYEGASPPQKDYAYFSNRHPLSDKSYDKAAWDESLTSTAAPTYFITGKTPTSAFSYGAELFITVYAVASGGSAVSISAATSQVNEKKKLEMYIQQYTAGVNRLLD